MVPLMVRGHHGSKVIARIEIADPLGGSESLTLVLPIAESYGATAEVAHQHLTLALTAASRPVVIASP